MNVEQWKPIPDFARYEVSDHGRVRRVGGRILKSAPNGDGYHKLHLGRAHQRYVHQLVLLAFIGPPPSAHNVDHRDFNRANNHLSNLRYLLKAINDFRWRKYYEDMDPVEIAAIEARYDELESAGAVFGWGPE